MLKITSDDRDASAGSAYSNNIAIAQWLREEAAKFKELTIQAGTVGRPKTACDFCRSKSIKCGTHKNCLKRAALASPGSRTAS